MSPGDRVHVRCTCRQAGRLLAGSVTEAAEGGSAWSPERLAEGIASSTSLQLSPSDQLGWLAGIQSMAVHSDAWRCLEALTAGTPRPPRPHRHPGQTLPTRLPGLHRQTKREIPRSPASGLLDGAVGQRKGGQRDLPLQRSVGRHRSGCPRQRGMPARSRKEGQERAARAPDSLPLPSSSLPRCLCSSCCCFSASSRRSTAEVTCGGGWAWLRVGSVGHSFRKMERRRCAHQTLALRTQ